MARTLDHQLTAPDETTARTSAAASDGLRHFLDEQPDLAEVQVSMSARGSYTVLQIPVPALRVLADVLTHLAGGHAVAVTAVEAELTTQQAADIMNVSRPYLDKLLEERKLPHRRVGNRRRVLLHDVLTYQRLDAARRRAAADELTAEAQRLGLDY